MNNTNYNLLPLKYFIDVVETHGFGSAARRNYVSESAISRTIKRLEIQLNANLIERTTSSFSITPTGEKVYHLASQLIENYNDFNKQINQLQINKQNLRIRFLNEFGMWAICAAQKIQTVFPDKIVSLEMEKFSNSINDLLANKYDILIGYDLENELNGKVFTHAISSVDFCFLFNSQFFSSDSDNFLKLLSKQTLLMQSWSNSSDMKNVQKHVLHDISQTKLDFINVKYCSSFETAALNVELNNGVAFYPANFSLPNNCPSVKKYFPEHRITYKVALIYKDSNLQSKVNNIKI